MGKKAAVEWASIDADPLKLLTEDVQAKGDSQAFLSGTWEQEPAVFRASPQRTALLAGLPSLLALAAAREAEGEPLELGEDVKASGEGEAVVAAAEEIAAGGGGGDDGPPATERALKKLLKAGARLSLAQPQRLDDSLWRLLAALERQLGCLVTCELHLAPKAAEAGPARYEGVEAWVVQVQGSSAWRVHVPSRGGACTRLANARSGELGEAELGEVLLEATLREGDVLYVPRGMPRQCLAPPAGDSAHLEVSTYRRWSWGDLAQFGVSVALANQALHAQLPAPLRAGLPPGFLAAAALGAGGGSGAGAASASALVAQLAAAVRGLADSLEGKGGAPQRFGGDLLATAADAMAEDFMRGRLPPHPSQLLEQGPPPRSGSDVVACRGSGLLRLVPLAAGDAPEADREESPSDCDGGDAAAGGGGGWVRLASCLQNDRQAHGMGEEEGEQGGGHGHGHSHEGACCGVPGCEHDHHHHSHGHGKHKGPGEGSESEVEPGSEDLGSSSSEEEEEEHEVEGVEEEEEEPPEELVFPAEFTPALELLLASAPPPGAGAEGAQGVRVDDLPLPAPELRLQLAGALWEAGVLATLPAHAAAAPGSVHAVASKDRASKGGAEQKEGKAAGGGKRSSGSRGGAAAKRPRK